MDSGPLHGIRIAACLLLFLGVASATLADTIHMKNGRIIRTAETRIVDDRVVFTQFGKEVSIPLSLVDRVVEDDEEGPPNNPVAPIPPRTPRAGEGEGEGSEGGTGTEGEEGGEPTDAEGQEVEAGTTREYWQGRLREIELQRTELQASVVDLRREERAFLFSHRSTGTSRERIEDVQQQLADLDQEVGDLREDTRRRSVPPGWLRLSPIQQ